MFSCIGMIFKYRMCRNVLCISPHFDIQLFNIRLAFLSELTHYYLTLAWVLQVSNFNLPNVWNLTGEFKPSHLCDAVSRLEPSTPSEMQARIPATHPLNSIWIRLKWTNIKIHTLQQEIICNLLFVTTEHLYRITSLEHLFNM